MPCARGVVQHGGLVEQHVVLDLVAGDRRADLLDRAAQQRDREVGDADGARQALAPSARISVAIACGRSMSGAGQWIR